MLTTFTPTVGYPDHLAPVRQMVLDSITNETHERRKLSSCSIRSACNSPLCPSCRGREAQHQSRRLLESAALIPENKLKLITSANVELPELREATRAITHATKAALKLLGIEHCAVRSEFSVDALIDSYHPHTHAIVSTSPTGRGYIPADDWHGAWIAELPVWLHPIEGGTHTERVYDVAGICRYVCKSPYANASPGTIGQIVAGIEATKGLRRFATSGAFKYQN